MGIHAGTEYADCSESFRVAAEAALHAGGDTALQISAPFVEWKKNDIFDYCVRRRVPVEATYSCEVGGPACGLCLSCRDRSFFYART